MSPLFSVPGRPDTEYLPVLRQIDAKHFALVEGFVYDGDCGRYEVRPEDLPATDLASVPWFLRWFVSQYGRHTRAALLHDHLVRNVPALDRAQADLVFGEVLRELRVGLIRRRLMWAAVALSTRFSRPWLPRRLFILVWVLAMIAGTTTLVVAIWVGVWGLALAAALAPVPACVLWLGQWRAGLWAGYGVALVGPPTLAILVAGSLYWVCDFAIALVTPQPGPTPPNEL